MEFEKNPEIAQRFPDLHPALDARAAVVEANRCLNCFDAPCMGACPTHIDVPGFIRRIATGNVTGSAKTILDANVLGASCARACPVQVLCEGACVLHGMHQKPIEIGRLQRFATETFYEAGGKLALRQRPERTQRIACIGAGPASLACAAELRQQGFQVRVIDRRPLPGGLNTYGVAEYKLRAADSLREVEMVRGLGVEFEVRDVNAASLTDLDHKFDAIFLGVGLGAMHSLDLAGTDSTGAGLIANTGIIDALKFIAAYKSGTPLSIGRRVVVIGAGNTAIDAACASKRLGAETVTILYRRQRENIAAFDFEFDHALREGVEFVWGTLPTAIASTNNALALTCVTVSQDANGQLTAQPGSEFTIVCDAVIPAVGQSPLLELLSQARGVTMQHGRVVIDRTTGQTANPKFFSGGDCVNGGREVVDAVADGKRAALGIAAWLNEQPLTHTEVPLG